jgi:hypothetical protein
MTWMRFILLALIIGKFSIIFSQLTENFSDGDFTNNPSWIGTTNDFIVNTDFQLQTNTSIATTSQLSTPHNIANFENKEWKVWTRLAFSPSSSNFARIFLSADNADLTLAQNGLYLQLGEAGTTDAVRLFKLVNGSATQMLAGTEGQIANSFTITIRVLRQLDGTWKLFIGPNGQDNTILTASTTDNFIPTGDHFGFLCTYTASNASRFYFDNIYVGDEIIDLVPPTISSAVATSPTNIHLFFNEAITTSSAEDLNKFNLNPTIAIVASERDITNQALVKLTLSTPLMNGVSYGLTANEISDIYGNVSGLLTTNVIYLEAEIPLKGEVIITEFMADPTPVIGLPEVEFVEIFNRSNKVFNLQGWKLGDASAEGTIGNGWLLPGEYKILTPTSSVPLFQNAVGVTSFPSLGNSSDDIYIKYDGVELDKLSYTDQWYRDEEKKAGGYTLERINLYLPCSDGLNWIASNSITGGTPGQQNSVYDDTPDFTAPEILETIASAPSNLQVIFNEGMDSTSLANCVITTSPTLSINQTFFNGSFPTTLNILFNETIQASLLYGITLENIADCSQNSTAISAQFVLPDSAEIGDIVINEILSNPLTGGSDYVELYNQSDKIINLIDWQFANFSSSAQGPGSIRTITKNYFLRPNDYLVVTKDSNHIKTNYPLALPGKFLFLDLPAYNNDSGTVFLMRNGSVYDKISYNGDWHFRLIDDRKGKSLERIDPKAPSNDGKNWHTAAETSGFGTPGRKNSQYLPFLYNGTFSFSSDIISPDGDGFEDILQITYEMSEPGLVGKAQIYDDRGRLVRTVFSNELLGTTGSFVWDGILDNVSKASIGIYIFHFEAFRTDGQLFFSKKAAITVAGKI